jgi:hypothetical protein
MGRAGARRRNVTRHGRLELAGVGPDEVAGGEGDEEGKDGGETEHDESGRRDWV